MALWSKGSCSMLLVALSCNLHLGIRVLAAHRLKSKCWSRPWKNREPKTQNSWKQSFPRRLEDCLKPTKELIFDSDWILIAYFVKVEIGQRQALRVFETPGTRAPDQGLAMGSGCLMRPVLYAPWLWNTYAHTHAHTTRLKQNFCVAHVQNC